MKKQLFLFTMLIYISFNSFGQCVDPIITDFECPAPSHPLMGSITTIANPFQEGINTSANVGKYTDDGMNAWDNMIVDYGAAINLSVNHFLKLKVYNVSGQTPLNLLAKLEGGTSAPAEIAMQVTNTGVWDEYVYDFSSQAAENHQRVVLFFNAGATNGTNADIYYIDDLRWDNNASLSVDNQILSQVKLYPNPTQGVININSKEIIDSFKITDITGKMVMKNKITGPLNKIDISILDNGIYFLTIKSDKAQRVIKILKN